MSSLVVSANNPNNGMTVRKLRTGMHFTAIKGELRISVRRKELSSKEVTKSPT